MTASHILDEAARRKANAKQAWMAALTWYDDEADEFAQDLSAEQVVRLREDRQALLSRAEKAFEAWWAQPVVTERSGTTEHGSYTVRLTKFK